MNYFPFKEFKKLLLAVGEFDLLTGE